ncbi:MAG: EscU/YscU/HrcU family type III secretion system export apparatus switch protein [Bdellovibrionales bacterium]|nr:EscU/YscU/HrcU family type III secretion system export apparatus switch protein [Bdellovibrionales bacterium]
MAEENDANEKTEAPTGRRISESRKQGQVGVSVDFSNVLNITGAFIALQYIGPALWRDMQMLLRGAFTSDLAKQTLSPHVLEAQVLGVVRLLLPEMMLLMLIAACCGAGCTAVQTKFLWSWHLIKPKMMHISPMKGIKRIFSMNNYINVFKQLVKLSIILPIAYFAFFDLFPQLRMLMDVSLDELLPFTAFAMSYIFWKIISLLFLLAVVDLIWQKYRNYKQLKMSKQEIKDERKAVEGDEATRRRIMAIGLKRARDRMMQAVPTADVVVTNPTHYAVALSYSMEPGTAPKVVAKGRGHVAKRIRELARQNGIPIVERRWLARTLYKSVEVNHEIPYELFKAVAELLAYVYRLKGRVPKKARDAVAKRNQARGAQR